VRIGLETLPQADLVRQIVAQQADFGVALFPVDHPDIEAHHLGEGKLVCLAPKGHPLAKLDVVRPADLAGHPLVSFDRAAPQRLMVSDAFIAADIPRDIAIEARLGQTACALVQQGAGIALVDEFSVMHEVFAGVAARPFASDVGFRVSFIHDRFRPLSALGGVFHEILKEITSSLGSRKDDKGALHNHAL
jgi:DNA-binding transcriptional LysR family regulator